MHHPAAPTSSSQITNSTTQQSQPTTQVMKHSLRQQQQPQPQQQQQSVSNASLPEPLHRSNMDKKKKARKIIDISDNSNDSIPDRPTSGTDTTTASETKMDQKQSSDEAKRRKIRPKDDA
jgi:hypothetical protein